MLAGSGWQTRGSGVGAVGLQRASLGSERRGGVVARVAARHAVPGGGLRGAAQHRHRLLRPLSEDSEEERRQGEAPGSPSMAGLARSTGRGTFLAGKGQGGHLNSREGPDCSLLRRDGFVERAAAAGNRWKRESPASRKTSSRDLLRRCAPRCPALQRWGWCRPHFGWIFPLN